MNNLRQFRPAGLPATLIVVIAALLALHVAPLNGAPSNGSAHDRKGPAPLFDGLGNFTKKVSTKDPLAQRYFNQGMMFLWGFNHSEAIRSFTAAATIDPKLAIAWWGVAFAHGPNINAVMEPGAVPPAMVALGKARALTPKASKWERAYINALAARYSDRADADQAQLNAAYAVAMREVARQYPKDLDAAVLHVDAVMNTMAWDYWLADKVTPKPETREMIAAIQAVLKKSPDHPGANHAMIHLVEAGPQPAEAMASAERLKFYAPDAGHLVHMPSHIFMRTGLYHEAALANERAAKADLAYIAECRAQGFYPGMYYPHNEHFLWWAYTFQRRRAEAYAKSAAIVKLANSPMCGTPVAEKQRFTHLHLLTAVRFGDWESILAAAEPPAGEALDRVMWHWARATAFAASAQREAAAQEASAARVLADSERVAAMDNAYLPAIKIANLAAHLAEGRAALVHRETEKALNSFCAAVAVEDDMPYMEPAFWFYPTRHTLGAVLLSAGKADEAADVFRRDLRNWPDNGWALHGLALALEKKGEATEATAVRKQFAAAWRHADIQPSLGMY